MNSKKKHAWLTSNQMILVYIIAVFSQPDRRDPPACVLGLCNGSQYDEGGHLHDVLRAL